MKKMPCLFCRDFTDKRRPVLLPTVTPGCEWVLAGEGIATRKWDGTAVMVKDGKVYARLDCKNGKTPPAGAIPCCDPDLVTGHWPHWIEATRPEDRWIREAAGFYGPPHVYSDGTYEAIGPKINGNPEGSGIHVFKRHGWEHCLGVERTFDGIRSWLAENFVEGIVFHHPDGRMCKIRRDDYGLPWPVPEVK